MNILTAKIARNNLRTFVPPGGRWALAFVPIQECCDEADQILPWMMMDRTTTNRHLDFDIADVILRYPMAVRHG